MKKPATSLLAALAAAAVVGVGAASADGPGIGTPTVVSVGDSAISGEAGRWAGNTNRESWRVDALGPTAYFDNPSETAETTPGCHRSKSAEIHIGVGVQSANLACSGARTYTQPYTGGDFKPGLDFYDDAAGHIGQAKALQAYASTRNVRMVVALIGANDFGFADIVQQCVTDWLFSPSWWPNYCNDDSSIRSRFTASNIAAITSRISGAFLNLQKAMRSAGYADSQWTLLVQTYSSPIPYGSQFRYSQSGYSRQTIGGCGLWNRDADWANTTALAAFNDAIRSGASATGMSNLRILDASNALFGRRLCERSVGLLEEVGLPWWRSPGASDRTEWVSQIRTLTTLIGPYQLQEDLHPSYWGQLALRNCVRQAYAGGAVIGGSCTPTGGLNAFGEPNMAFGFLP